MSIETKEEAMYMFTYNDGFLYWNEAAIKEHAEFANINKI